MSTEHDFGFWLANGTRIVHGEGSITKNAFPPEMEIPGQLQVFQAGHIKDDKVPTYNGMFGCLHFDVNTRMPRHVHMTDATIEGESKRYVVESILVLNGVAIAELGGEIYVVPPKDFDKHRQRRATYLDGMPTWLRPTTTWHLS